MGWKRPMGPGLLGAVLRVRRDGLTGPPASHPRPRATAGQAHSRPSARASIFSNDSILGPTSWTSWSRDEIIHDGVQMNGRMWALSPSARTGAPAEAGGHGGEQLWRGVGGVWLPNVRDDPQLCNGHE